MESELENDVIVLIRKNWLLRFVPVVSVKAGTSENWRDSPKFHGSRCITWNEERRGNPGIRLYSELPPLWKSLRNLCANHLQNSRNSCATFQTGTPKVAVCLIVRQTMRFQKSATSVRNCSAVGRMKNWDELYSTFGEGGSLNQEGVVEFAQKINRKRETLHKLQVVLETHLCPVAVNLIETLYEMVRIQSNPAESEDPAAPIVPHQSENLTECHLAAANAFLQSSEATTGRQGE